MQIFTPVKELGWRWSTIKPVLKQDYEQRHQILLSQYEKAMKAYNLKKIRKEKKKIDMEQGIGNFQNKTPLPHTLNKGLSIKDVSTFSLISNYLVPRVKH